MVPDAQVITADDIALHQSVFAFDALAALPEVHISRAGAFGGVTTVRIRGASSDKTLVLIDGAPVNDPTSPAGGFDFSSLDLADVARIEVLSGPQGSLWGSDAIGGVIAIVTREPDGLRAGGEAGSFGTKRLTASAGTAGEHGALGIGAAWFDTGGISKADSRDGNTERDPFDSLTLQANGRVDPCRRPEPGRQGPLQPRPRGLRQFRRPYRRHRRAGQPDQPHGLRLPPRPT